MVCKPNNGYIFTMNRNLTNQSNPIEEQHPATKIKFKQKEPIKCLHTETIPITRASAYKSKQTWWLRQQRYPKEPPPFSPFNVCVWKPACIVHEPRLFQRRGSFQPSSLHWSIHHSLIHIHRRSALLTYQRLASCDRRLAPPIACLPLWEYT